MVQTEPAANTRLQARIDGQDAKIETIDSKLNDLTSLVYSMRDLLSTLPKSMEKMEQMIQGQQFNAVKRPTYEEFLDDLDREPTVDDTSGSNVPPPLRPIPISPCYVKSTIVPLILPCFRSLK